MESYNQECAKCYEKLNSQDFKGLFCDKIDGKHYFCLECTPKLIKYVMDNIKHSIPFKCFKCKYPINHRSFRKNLNEEQRFKILKEEILQTLQPDEYVQYCPLCTEFYMILEKNDRIRIFQCYNESCKKLSCSLCKEELKTSFGHECKEIQRSRQQSEQLIQKNNNDSLQPILSGQSNDKNQNNKSEDNNDKKINNKSGEINNKNQNNTPGQINNKNQNDTFGLPQCAYLDCGILLSSDHTFYRCTNEQDSHHLCEEHTKEFMDSLFKELSSNVPTQCSFIDENTKKSCQQLVEHRSLRKNMTNNQRVRYLFYEASQTMNSQEEKLVYCKFCFDYFVFVQNDFDHLIIFDCEKCYAKQCLICNQKVEEGYQNEKLHQKCKAQQKNKELWDAQIQDSISQKCPNPKCGHQGLKDDQCTHLRCDKCKFTYCYICQADLSSLQSDFDHNIDWANNNQTCPLYLEEFRLVDQDWPDNADEALQYYHDIKLNWNMQKLIKQIGKEALQELINSFSEVKDYNIDIKKILALDLRNTILFKRGILK